MRTRLLTCLLLPVLILACDDEPDRGRPNGPGARTLGESNVTTDALRRAVTRLSVCYRSDLDGYFEAVLGLSEVRGARAAQFSDQVTCINAAATCEGANACIGVRIGGCEADTFACEDAVAVECYDDEDGRVIEERTDCARDPDGNTRCDPQSVTCVGPQACEASRCDGDRRIDCFDGTAFLEDCALSGRTCAEVDGQPDCVPVGAAPCESACDGDIALQCFEGRVVGALDCSLLGFECNPVAGADLPCMPAVSECENRATRCVDQIAEICLMGAWFSFDCAEAGGRCVAENDWVECVQ